MESVIPVFQVKALDAVLPFYQSLGFQVTYQQDKPYIYGAVQRGNINIHFVKGTSSMMCLVLVPNVEDYHKTFADGLRTTYGKVLTRGMPRITRFRPGQTRFTVYDPAGNSMLFINQDEPDIDYDAYDDSLSPLMQVLENVKFVRDTYTDDQAAAKLLDKKLLQHQSASPIDRARALGVRAELAIAMGDVERAQTIRKELAAIHLTDEERTIYRDELQAAERLERWLTESE
jgi:hypothetical protein